MGASSCCSSSPPIEKKNEPHVKQTNQITTTNTTRKTQQETNKDINPDDDSLELSENEVNEIMGDLQLFLSFLQARTSTRKTIGQGGQGKIIKYYSNKYQREVVEKNSEFK